MEVYRAECAEILRRYRLGMISYAECMTALASAVAALAPAVGPESLASLRSSIEANNDAVEKLKASKLN